MRKKNNVITQTIFQTFPIDSIESALVIKYLEDNNIHVYNNKLIRNIVRKEKQDDVSAIVKILVADNQHLSIHDLVKYFELLVPSEDKSINGAFFTPQIITKNISEEIIDAPDLMICDPSCGCGAFLLEAAILLKKKYGRSVKESLEKNLFGADIADYSIRRAKLLLSLLAVSNGEDKESIHFNLIVDNSLKMNWKKQFPSIFKNEGFDRIIGNPPYVRYQDLQDKTRESLYNDWTTLKKGNYNLYFAFFELGIKLLNNTGKLGYITPNNYFTSLTGIELRSYLVNSKLINKIIDFSHIKLFDARTYTAITYLDKTDKNSFLFTRILDIEKFNKLTDLDFSQILFTSLNNKKWRLLETKDQNNIRQIENSGEKLGGMFDIRVGIATLKDKVYFIDGSKENNGFYLKEYKGIIYKIEKDITKSIVKISDFKTQDDLNRNNRRIIFPYIKSKGTVKLIDETALSNEYPNAYSYLLAVRRELETRDKGKGDYPSWYAYARTQGLDFYGRKLLTPTFSKKPRFLFESNPDSLFCNGYAIFERPAQDALFKTSKLNLLELQKILNSDIMDYYIKKTSVSIDGGYPCYQKNFIEPFNIPYFSDQELVKFNGIKDSKEINDFLTKTYNLDL